MAVIAGKDRYPLCSVRSIRRFGLPICLVGFEGETESDLIASFPESQRRLIKVGQVGRLLKALEDMSATYALMVGQITPKRLFRGLHPDLKAMRLLGGLKERNASTIFGSIRREIEAIGITMLDARAFLDHDLTTPGSMTSSRARIDETALRHGARIARAVAALDIGQSVVVKAGTVIAVEAFEGTDAMIRRAGTLDVHGTIFIKTSKPRQDFHFDVPVFGLRTLELLKASGIHTAGLEAGRTIMLDRSSLIEQADAWHINLVGYHHEKSEAGH